MKTENLNLKCYIKSLQLEYIKLKSENNDITEIKNKIEVVYKDYDATK